MRGAEESQNDSGDDVAWILKADVGEIGLGSWT
jgi:hypothetical protein